MDEISIKQMFMIAIMTTADASNVCLVMVAGNTSSTSAVPAVTSAVTLVANIDTAR